MATTPRTVKPDLSSLRITDTKRKSSRSGKVWLWVLLPFIVLGLIYAGAFSARSRKPEVEVVTAVKPSSAPAGVLNASGYITPRRRATIAAKITGRVTGVYFDEGTIVKEGQLLAKLDDSDVLRSLESAKADRDASQAAIADYQGSVEERGNRTSPRAGTGKRRGPDPGILGLSGHERRQPSRQD